MVNSGPYPQGAAHVYGLEVRDPALRLRDGEPATLRAATYGTSPMKTPRYGCPSDPGEAAVIWRGKPEGGALHRLALDAGRTRA